MYVGWPSSTVELHCRHDGLRAWIAELYGLDIGVGRVLDKLDALDLARNTVVIFSSDHGPGGVIPNANEPRDCNLFGSSGIFDGGKHNTFEGGIRVPLIVRWPGRVLAGVVNSRSTFSFTDYLPTLCVLAKVPPEEVPADVDGVDASAGWTVDVEQSAPLHRDQPLLWFNRQRSVITVVHHNFKYLHHETPSSQRLPDGTLAR